MPSFCVKMKAWLKRRMPSSSQHDQILTSSVGHERHSLTSEKKLPTPTTSAPATKQASSKHPVLPLNNSSTNIETPTDSAAGVVPRQLGYPEAPSVNLAMETLRSQLSKPKQRMGLSIQKGAFTDEILANILTVEAITAALPTIQRDLKNFVHSNTKILAILLRIIQNEDHLVYILKSFWFHNFNNASLPVANLEDDCDVIGQEYCALEGECSNEGSSPCRHHTRFNVFHHYPWNDMLRKDFFERQWEVLIPFLEFFLDDEPQECDPNAILPVNYLSRVAVGSGHFSKVYHGEILASRQSVFQTVREILDRK